MKTMYQFRVTFETKMFQTTRHFWLATREEGQVLRAALAARYPDQDITVEYQTIDHVMTPDEIMEEVQDEMDLQAALALGR